MVLLGVPLTVGESDFVLPVGTVTLLLLDVVGSSRLWERSPDVAAEGLAALNELLDDAIGRHEGVRPVEQGEGDSAVAAFSRPSDAVACAVEVQATTPLPVRIGLHTGEVQLRDQGNYMGTTINRCARIRNLGHAGQTLLSHATRDLVVDTDAVLRDLGIHRLRDLARPEHLFQLGVDDYPPLQSLDLAPNNLPLQLTSFIGRETEMATLRRLLADTRLLTITGPGGCGKTRLALHTAAEAIDQWSDGVWFVDLAPLNDPELVVPALVGVLGLKEQEGRTPLETVVAHLASKRALVLLDNCEHVIGAAAELTAAILRGCPSVAVLATSREPLAVAGEVTWLVPSLGMPTSDEPDQIEALASCDAVRLFVARATRARPNFAVTNETAPAVAQICQRLDGIPLAIELAAARVRVLSPQEIAAGLDNRFKLLGAGPRTAMPRHQTLRASIDSSWDLLRDDERVLLRRLGFFAGSFDLDAAEHVCGFDPLTPLQVLDVLASLVERSLVVTQDGSETRYTLLETIRQYATEQAQGAGESEACASRHLAYFASVVEAAEPLLGSDQRRGLAIIDRELDNIRVALRQSLESQELEPGASICGALFVYWYVRGRYEEGRRWCDPIIDRGATLDARLLGPVLFADGYLATLAGDLERGGELMAHATATAIECGDTKTEARARGFAAQVAVTTDGSREAFEELGGIIELSRKAGDTWNAIDNLVMLATFEYLLFGVAVTASAIAEAEREATRAGDVDHAAGASAFRFIVDLFGGDVRAAGESLVSATDALSNLGQTHIGGLALVAGALAAVWSGDGGAARALSGEAAGEAAGTIAEALAHWPEGLVAMSEGKPAEARRLIAEARSEWVCILWRVLILVDLADACVLDGDLEEARASLDEALGIARQLGNPYDEGRVLAGLARLERAQEDDESAEALFHDALRLHVTARDRMAIATTLESLAAISNDEAAARLYGAAFAMREDMGYRWAMPSHALEGATGWAEGLGLSVDDAVAYAQRGRGERKRAATGWASLTPTELKVVDLVAEGLTNAQLAERMFIAVGTAKTHVAHVFAKLGVTTRAELATLATKRKSEN